MVWPMVVSTAVWKALWWVALKAGAKVVMMVEKMDDCWAVKSGNSLVDHLVVTKDVHLVGSSGLCLVGWWEEQTVDVLVGKRVVHWVCLTVGVKDVHLVVQLERVMVEMMAEHSAKKKAEWKATVWVEPTAATKVMHSVAKMAPQMVECSVAEKDDLKAGLMAVLKGMMRVDAMDAH